MSTAQKIGTAVLLAFALTGCSDRAGYNEHRASPDHLGLSHPGKQLFTCNDSSVIGVDVLPGGLTLDLRQPPTAAAERLTAAAEGLPFVGQTTSIAHSHDTIAVMRRDRPTMVCRTTRDGDRPARHPKTNEPEVRKPT